jgi:cyclopropane fatty-acyl-phospholipid synthase-like methyltransferase
MVRDAGVAEEEEELDIGCGWKSCSDYHVKYRD